MVLRMVPMVFWWSKGGASGVAGAQGSSQERATAGSMHIVLLNTSRSHTRQRHHRGTFPPALHADAATRSVRSVALVSSTTAPGTAVPPSRAR